MQRTSIARWLLIIAIAGVFALFGVDKFVTPSLWLGWIPFEFEGIMGLTRENWLTVFGALEVVTALLLVIPVRRIQQAGCLLAIIQLIGILSQTGFDDTGIRDLGLLLANVALYCLL